MIYVINGVTPPLVRLVAGLANAAQSIGTDVFITYARNGVHKEGSLHYRYGALDIRTHNLTVEQRTLLLTNLQSRFPKPQFDVLLESAGTPNEHIHVEDNTAPLINADEVNHAEGVRLPRTT